VGSRRWYEDDRVTQVLDDGELLYVAVATLGGPRVTPIAFSVERRRLWFVVPRRSVKARAIAQRARVGGLIRAGRRAVMLCGRAQLVDPLTARGVMSVDRLVALPFAATGYLGRNLGHAAGVAQGRPTPTLPISRVAVAVDASHLALLDRGAPVAHWGPWKQGEASFDERGARRPAARSGAAPARPAPAPRSRPQGGARMAVPVWPDRRSRSLAWDHG
jgi:Pyridoxamine 5'-phosphate oxidase